MLPVKPVINIFHIYIVHRNAILTLSKSFALRKDRKRTGKGDRKKTKITELIGKFGGGDGKRKPFDRSDKEENVSEGIGEVINLGLSRI